MDGPADIYLSIILPAYNEGPAVVEAIEHYAACAGHWGIASELLVIDDGSRDDTLCLAEAAARRHSAVRVLSNPTNLGQAATLLRGFRASRGRVTMHNAADLPFAPEDTPRVLASLRGGADVVVVQRTNRHAYGLFRKLTSWVNSAIIKWLFGSPLQDHNFVQAYRRSVLDAIEVESRGVSTVTTELILKALGLGVNVQVLEAHYQRRRHGQSTITMHKILQTVKELLRLYAIMRRWRREAPPRTSVVMARCSTDSLPPEPDRFERTTQGKRLPVAKGVSAAEQVHGGPESRLNHDRTLYAYPPIQAGECHER
jgi:glycosyltransferase involved in cell wall biosynthesis